MLQLSASTYANELTDDCLICKSEKLNSPKIDVEVWSQNKKAENGRQTISKQDMFQICTIKCLLYMNTI